jgi:hypothetical protein
MYVPGKTISELRQKALIWMPNDDFDINILDRITYLMFDTQDRIIDNFNNIYRDVGRYKAAMSYLEDLYLNWRALKCMHEGHSEPNEDCFLCPTENEDTVCGFDDVSAIECDEMEEMLIEVIEFISKNRDRDECTFFQSQYKYATNMLMFWRGLSSLRLSPTLSDIHKRALGFHPIKTRSIPSVFDNSNAPFWKRCEKNLCLCMRNIKNV